MPRSVRGPLSVERCGVALIAEGLDRPTSLDANERQVGLCGLSWLVSELNRGHEGRSIRRGAFCTPCTVVSSNAVWPSPLTACQGVPSVQRRRAGTGENRSSRHLVRHLLPSRVGDH